MSFLYGLWDSWLRVAASIAVTFGAYILGLAIYRLVLHPLAGFPGPKLAGLTQWYEFYYNGLQPGQFTFHLESLHDRYGPIVRCNPCELHIRDPDFFETIYALDSPRDKVRKHVEWAGNTLAAQATVSHELHRLRRSAQNAFFSKRQLRAFEPHIQTATDRLVARLEQEWKGTSRPVNLGDAFGCFTGDIIMQYCFARDHDFLAAPDFRSPFVESVHQLQRSTHVMMHFPVLPKVMRQLPESILPAIAMPMIQFERDMARQIQDLIQEKNQGHKDANHPTVFKELLDSDLPPQEKTSARLQHEAVTLVGAGQETSKFTLTMAMFYLLKQPETMATLRMEILSVFPDPHKPPSLAELEALPYVTAVIMESLRLSYGAVSRLPRQAKTPLRYGNFTIPAYTPLSMNHYAMHHDERLFPDSHRFIPERWLNNPRAPVLDGKNANPVDKEARETGGKLLSRYMVSFSRGTRQCLGMNFAWAEIYIMLASIVRRCNLELYETDWADVGFSQDFSVPHAGPNARGLRVLVNQ